jgi:hypothetical protein
VQIILAVGRQLLEAQLVARRRRILLAAVADFEQVRAFPGQLDGEHLLAGGGCIAIHAAPENATDVLLGDAVTLQCQASMSSHHQATS